MALSFTAGNTAESMTDDSPTLKDCNALEFNEMAFRRALILELKRTGISRRPFILMVVSLAEIPAAQNGYSPRKRAVEAIASSIRDTDMLGWYKSGQTIGVLLTEIGAPLKDAVDSIMERINAKLSSSLDEEELKDLNIAIYYMLPEKAAQTGMMAGDQYDFEGPPCPDCYIMQPFPPLSMLTSEPIYRGPEPFFEGVTQRNAASA